MRSIHLLSPYLAAILVAAGCSKKTDTYSERPNAGERDGSGSQVFEIGTENEDLLQEFSEKPFTHPSIPNVANAGNLMNRLESTARRPSTVVYLRKHGAIADDGRDDTASFYAALDSARAFVAEGKQVTVQMEEGTYDISDALFVEGGHTFLRGHGIEKTTLRFHASLQEAIPIGHPREKTFSWRGGMIWFCPNTTRELELSKPEFIVQDVNLPAGTTRIPLANANDSFQRGDVVRTIFRGGSEMVREASGNSELNIADYRGWRVLDINGYWWLHNINIVESVTQDHIEFAKPLRMHLKPGRALFVSQSKSELAIGGGADNFTLQFMVGEHDHKYIHLHEKGYNAFFLHKIAFAKLSNLRIVDADNAVILESSHHCSLGDIKSNGSRKAHHGVSLRNSHDNLITGWTQHQRVQHGLSIQDYSSGNVFASCEMDHGTLDCHRGMPFDNVRTDIVIHRADGSGGGAFGPTAGRRIVTWNVRATAPTWKGKPRLKGIRAFTNPKAYPRSALVGVNGLPEESKPDGGTVEVADWNKIPSNRNLYTFQKGLKPRTEKNQ